MKLIHVLASFLVTFVLLAAGCQKPVYFPAESLDQKAKAVGALAAYDPHGKGKAEFFLFADPNGRVNRIGYCTDGTEKPREMVDLDHLDKRDFPHLVIILDGFGYQVVKQYYDEGGLRYCHPPSRVIAPYPTLTDPCLEDLLGYIPCIAFEAEYFDHRQNRMAGGSAAYLEGANEPYNKILQYRANTIWDAIGYIYPWPVFGHEVNDVKRVFDKGATREMLVYFVSSAAVGTQQGADGQRKCLVLVNQLINQIMWETHGKLRVTLAADHGHSYTPSTRIPLEQHLKSKGWRLTEKLQRPKDAVYIRFGLETYASFCTREPAHLASDLVQAKGVDLASYIGKVSEDPALMAAIRQATSAPDVDRNAGGQEEALYVLDGAGGKAAIRHHGDAYQYLALSGDPLKLKDILHNMGQADGFHSEEQLRQATWRHYYPIPLSRLWRGHFGLVHNPPDVIVSLADNYYSGSTGFGGVVKIASTHGSLNARNSTTFIMSNIAPLPEFMESHDIPRHMQEITGQQFPARK